LSWLAHASARRGNRHALTVETPGYSLRAGFSQRLDTRLRLIAPEGCMRLLHDVKVAVRTAVRARFISALAVIAFALGIGATTAVFSIFNGVLLQPLPFPHPEDLVAVFDTQPACPTCPASFPKYHDWRERNQVFSAIGGSTFVTLVLTGNGDPARIIGAPTTASFVDVFGVQPQLGRWFTEEEDRPGGPKVV